VSVAEVLWGARHASSEHCVLSSTDDRHRQATLSIADRPGHIAGVPPIEAGWRDVGVRSFLAGVTERDDRGRRSAWRQREPIAEPTAASTIRQMTPATNTLPRRLTSPSATR
jgi:hypothetical protein